ncbi:hypothetical protein PR048_023892 [Dryococelus australis]|uniref:Uncharacterized protein n=1 Tax=Dryococelus australis TaxID=614101 RepID=A0ABQ9GVE7_9NEOP|nr:hypothetical protein PR048_023892 [Dryococelus australis]
MFTVAWRLKHQGRESGSQIVKVSSNSWVEGGGFAKRLTLRGYWHGRLRGMGVVLDRNSHFGQSHLLDKWVQGSGTATRSDAKNYRGSPAKRRSKQLIGFHASYTAINASLSSQLDRRVLGDLLTPAAARLEGSTRSRALYRSSRVQTHPPSHSTKEMNPRSTPPAKPMSMEQRRNARAGETEVPQKNCRPATSSGTIPTRDNPGATPPGIEPGSAWWESCWDFFCYSAHPTSKRSEDVSSLEISPHTCPVSWLRVGSGPRTRFLEMLIENWCPLCRISSMVHCDNPLRCSAIPITEDWFSSTVIVR